MDEARQWLDHNLPDIHLMMDGCKGGWMASCETCEGDRMVLHFRSFPTPEDIRDAAIQAIEQARKA